MMHWDRFYGLEPPTEPVQLEAGPLSLQLIGDTIRHISCNDCQLVSRIFFAIRDTNWGTLENCIHKRVIQATEEGLLIKIQVSADRDGIAALWSAEISLGKDGSLSYLVSGRAQRDFACNRVSLIVHYPQAAAGKEVRYRLKDGREVEARLPRLISAPDPFVGFDRFVYQAMPAHWLQVEFPGQTCQMEDQRNFGDDGFKIFWPPMDSPRPVFFEAGQQFKCRVILRLKPVPTRVEVIERTARISLHGQSGQRLIRLGYSINDLAKGANPTVPAEALAVLKPAHFRVVLDPRQEDWVGCLEHASDFANELGVPLWVAIRIPLEGLDPALVQKLAGLAVQPDRLILQPLDFWAPDYNAMLGHMAQMAMRYGLKSQVGVGNEHGFAGLHRNPPSFKGLDFITWAYNPQQHNSDLHTALENLATPAQMALAMAQLAPGLPLAISPVTMRPLWNPHHAREDFQTTVRGLPRPLEPAHWGMFGAVWSLLSIKHLSHSPLGEATYFELTGPGGLLYQPSCLHQPALADLPQAKIYPLFHVFRELGPRAGAELWQLNSTRPDLVDGLAIAQGEGLLLYLANLSGSAQEVDLAELTRHIQEARLYSAEDWTNLVSRLDYRPSILDLPTKAIINQGPLHLEPMAILRLALTRP